MQENQNDQQMLEARTKIKEEFTYYLSNIAKSSQRTEKGFNLQPTAVQSFLSFLEVDRLFDYAPEIWRHIKSMYDVTAPNEVEKIIGVLLNNEKFIMRDKQGSKYYRSGSIIHYACFVRARSYFMNERRTDSVKSPDQKKTDIILGDAKDSPYRPYITAIKSKPFLLLAGISGTGKSRIVRELAKACWEVGSEEYKEPKPKNFQMIQVKPNWHDSSELIGYVSRVSGKAEFVAGDFLKFVARAWEDTDTPYFLCLDEMNLAPVEQYFAEYLSVIETRKVGDDGTITTDPILCVEHENSRDEHTGDLRPKEWYKNLVDELLADCPAEKADELKEQFMEKGISIPQNLIVVGTVNMDETTFSFSRKVLDRAMTIEMNKVDLYGGLTDRHEPIGKLGTAELVGDAVEGVDVYAEHEQVCNKAIDYLAKVNEALGDTPFKVAYRTRNELLLYVVNNLPYNKDADGNELPQDLVIARALDEITCMKVLSRIEGDTSKVDEWFLDNLRKAIEDGLHAIAGEELLDDPISLAKLNEMKLRLKSGYTSFWS